MNHISAVALSFRDGNQMALEDFYKKYFPGLCWFLKRRFNTDMKDLSQNVLEKFISQKDKFHSEAHAKAFIYTTGRNLCLNDLKAQPRELERNKVFDSETRSPVTSPDDILIGIYHDYLLKMALNEIHKLPDPYRQVLVLSLLEDKSHAWIAEELSIKESYVATLKSRGLVLLRERTAVKNLIYYIKRMVFILLSLLTVNGHHPLVDLIKKIVAHFL